MHSSVVWRDEDPGGEGACHTSLPTYFNPWNSVRQEPTTQFSTNTLAHVPVHRACTHPIITS